jgi:hypothetical protein
MVPELTPLLQAAQTRGLEVVRGREMGAQQWEGVADFFGWTVPPAEQTAAAYALQLTLRFSFQTRLRPGVRLPPFIR